MNSRRTRKGGSHISSADGQTPLRGGGIMTFIKKPFYGSKNPKYKLDVTESTSYDTNMYEIAGVIHLKIDTFSFIRAQSYIDQYLKKDLIENILKKYPNASRIIGYNVNKIEGTYSKCGDYYYKQKLGMTCRCGTACPGYYIVYGIALKNKEVSAGTKRLTKTGPAKTRSRSKSKSKSN